VPRPVFPSLAYFAVGRPVYVKKPECPQFNLAFSLRRSPDLWSGFFTGLIDCGKTELNYATIRILALMIIISGYWAFPK
jgi:hypothetical protein